VTFSPAVAGVVRSLVIRLGVEDEGRWAPAATAITWVKV